MREQVAFLLSVLFSHAHPLTGGLRHAQHRRRSRNSSVVKSRTHSIGE